MRLMSICFNHDDTTFRIFIYHDLWLMYLYLSASWYGTSTTHILIMSALLGLRIIRNYSLNLLMAIIQESGWGQLWRFHWRDILCQRLWMKSPTGWVSNLINYRLVQHTCSPLSMQKPSNDSTWRWRIWDKHSISLQNSSSPWRQPRWARFTTTRWPPCNAALYTLMCTSVPSMHSSLNWFVTSINSSSEKHFTPSNCTVPSFLIILMTNKHKALV